VNLGGYDADEDPNNSDSGRVAGVDV